jgi:hypothetical protein
MKKGDLVVFVDKRDITDRQYFGFSSNIAPYENKLGLILKTGGVKTSHVYFFGIDRQIASQCIWNISHDYLKLVSISE